MLPADYLKEQKAEIFGDGEPSGIEYVFPPRSGATMETYVAEVAKPSNGNILAQFPFTRENFAEQLKSLNNTVRDQGQELQKLRKLPNEVNRLKDDRIRSEKELKNEIKRSEEKINGLKDDGIRSEKELKNEIKRSEEKINRLENEVKGLKDDRYRMANANYRIDIGKWALSLSTKTTKNQRLNKKAKREDSQFRKTQSVMETDRDASRLSIDQLKRIGIVNAIKYKNELFKKIPKASIWYNILIQLVNY